MVTPPSLVLLPGIAIFHPHWINCSPLWKARSLVVIQILSMYLTILLLTISIWQVVMLKCSLNKQEKFLFWIATGVLLVIRPIKAF